MGLVIADVEGFAKPQHCVFWVRSSACKDDNIRMYVPRTAAKFSNITQGEVDEALKRKIIEQFCKDHPESCVDLPGQARTSPVMFLAESSSDLHPFICELIQFNISSQSQGKAMCQ